MYTLHTTTPGGRKKKKSEGEAQRKRKRDRQDYKRNAFKHRNEQKL